MNGPAVAAHGADIVVAWYTAAESVPRVRLVRSSDGGASFGFTAVGGCDGTHWVGLMWNSTIRAAPM